MDSILPNDGLDSVRNRLQLYDAASAGMKKLIRSRALPIFVLAAIFLMFFMEPIGKWVGLWSVR